MANGRNQNNSHPCLLKMITATAGRSKKVVELGDVLEEGIAAGERPGAGIIDDNLLDLGKKLE